MKVAEVELKNAEKVKNKLIEIAALNTEFLPKKEGERLYFPLLEDADVSLVKEIKIVEKDMPKKKKKIDILDEFSEFLTSKEIEDMPKSQEIVGDIMILEIPENLIGKEKKIAKTYLENNKNVKVVVKKSAIHSGQFRTRKVEVLAGENRKDTTHLESKIRLYLDLEKTYFSTRLGNERLRIAKLVSKGEKVLIMFSGSGPYPLILAKHSEAKKIIGIELNPDAHQFAIENRKKNKINEERVELINGDVKSEVPTP